MSTLKNHRETIEANPHLTTIALGKQLGVSASTVWRVRKTLGLESNGKRGTERKDRSSWDWSLRNIELAKIHGVSRQRISVLRKVYGEGSGRGKKTTPNERKTRPTPADDLRDQEDNSQVPSGDAVE